MAVADRFVGLCGVAVGELPMTERGSAVAAGGPAREQAREAVTGEAGCDRRTGRREVRPPTEEGGRQPSRCLRACVTAEAEARAEAVPKV